MSERNDRDYFANRARQERAIASISQDNSIASVHLRMADAYERRIRETARPPAMSHAPQT